MGVINDTWGSSSLSSFSKSYTLDDLEKDDEFQKTSERFLESVGEKSDDVFEYLRDSDFNLSNTAFYKTKDNLFLSSGLSKRALCSFC